MIGDVELHHPLADLLQALGLGRHHHAVGDGVVHDAACRAAAISTRQRRQEPNASTESVAQSLGTWVPISIAARMIEVPAAPIPSGRRW